MEPTGCAVVGGGPAGMVLGLLLARAGVQVAVLEKHSDFLRDFRGDTVHPSTIRLIDELGLGDGFRKLPQSRLRGVAVPVPGKGMVTLADFSSLKPPYDYIAMMPQWDLLDFLASKAAAEPGFTLLMDHEATGLAFDGGRVTGVRYRTAGTAGPAGESVLSADVVVAADGRKSVLRRAAGLHPREYPVPFDTWWFKLPRRASESGEIAGVVPSLGDRDAMIALNRTDYYQMGYLAPKGADARIRAGGVERFRQRVAALRPDLADRVDSIQSLEDLHWLDVRLDRLPRWYVDGFLCIGDAAHAMSPAGGVGINLAIQDAVAAAARLAPDLLRGHVRAKTLAAVQRRRRMPTVAVQAVQRLMHRVIFVPLFAGTLSGDMLAGKRPGASFSWQRLLFFFLRHNPVVRRLLPRLIGFGPRPEHAPAFARPAAIPPPTKLESMTSPTDTAVDTAAARARLLELIKELAVVRGKVILSSGAEADYYIDLRRITLHHEASRLVGQVMLALADEAGIDFECAGGLTMGADPVGTAVMHAAVYAGRSVDAFVVRKAQKSYGMGRQVEGPSVEGRKVLVLEDTSTTGGSALTAVEGVRKAGGNVVAVAVIVDRDTGAKEKIEAETGVPYLYAFGKDELGLA
ncbi:MULTISPECIES: orotate phosphoribosyltransferase [unclassified Arthrobacter]|uniref:orotate phosphoribosyltransferase n=1 Tax=unclassified Arthrobacter TaxID=235627 RepID=UPI0035AF1466